MKKHLLSLSIVAILFGGGGFAAGWLLKTNHSILSGGGYSTNATHIKKRHKGNSNSHTVGTVLSVSPSSITIKLPNGSTEIIYVSGTTTYSQQTPTTNSNIRQGASIIVSGPTNSNGSVTANRITIK